MVPGTYAQYTTRRVLTSEWIEGEKLSQSRANDVAPTPPAWCSVACRSPRLLCSARLLAGEAPRRLGVSKHAAC